MLSITGHKENANQNLNPVKIDTYYQEHKQKQMFIRMWYKRNPHKLMVEVEISITTMENSMKSPQKNHK
jgi:hypothetical protein